MNTIFLLIAALSSSNLAQASEIKSHHGAYLVARIQYGMKLNGTRYTYLQNRTNGCSISLTRQMNGDHTVTVQDKGRTLSLRISDQLEVLGKKEGAAESFTIPSSPDDFVKLDIDALSTSFTITLKNKRTLVTCWNGN